MAAFFDKLQRATAVMDDGRVPGYLRTHPMSIDRMSDAQNRAQNLRYKQTPDSLDYHLVRAKLRAASGDAQDAVASFASLLRDRRFASEVAAHYGLARALLRARRVAEAQAEVDVVRAAKAESPMVDILAAEVRHAAGDNEGALAILEAARPRYPQRRSVLYAQVAALQALGRDAQALAVLEEPLRLYRPTRSCTCCRPSPTPRSASGCCSTRRRPRSMCCAARCRRRSISSSSRAAPATATSTSTRRSTPGCASCARATRRRYASSGARERRKVHAPIRASYCQIRIPTRRPGRCALACRSSHPSPALGS